MEKIYKTVVKNVKSFRKISLAKGVDLSPLKKEKRHTKKRNSKGISTVKYGQYWFNTPKGKGIFKTYDDEYCLLVKNLRIINEILCYYLAKQVNIDCAKYEPAHIKDYVGLISYNVLNNENDELISLSDLLKYDYELSPTLEDTMAALDGYKSDMGYTVDRQKILEDIYKVVVFDTLTLQSDRNSANLNFVFTQDNQIKLAPLFDNELAFCVDFLAMN